MLLGCDALAPAPAPTTSVSCPVCTILRCRHPSPRPGRHKSHGHKRMVYMVWGAQTHGPRTCMTHHTQVLTQALKPAAGSPQPPGLGRRGRGEGGLGGGKRGRRCLRFLPPNLGDWLLISPCCRGGGGAEDEGGGAEVARGAEGYGEGGLEVYVRDTGGGEWAGGGRGGLDAGDLKARVMETVSAAAAALQSRGDRGCGAASAGRLRGRGGGAC